MSNRATIARLEGELEKAEARIESLLSELDALDRDYRTSVAKRQLLEAERDRARTLNRATEAAWEREVGEVEGERDRLREALVQIAENTPDEPDLSHSDGGYDAGQIARAALNPEGDDE